MLLKNESVKDSGRYWSANEPSSTPPLVTTNISALFNHFMAALIDLEEDYASLGYAYQNSHGLFYIPTAK